MKEKNNSTECCKEKVIYKNHNHYDRGGSGAIYGLGIIGALFYFLQNATSFSMVMIGIGKAIFWPAILMFKLLTFLQM